MADYWHLDNGILLGKFIRINKPEYFKDAGFLSIINTPGEVFTWHKPGTKPNEYSDVVLWFEDGSDTIPDFPENIYNDIVETVLEHFSCGLIWITNLSAEQAELPSPSET